MSIFDLQPLTTTNLLTIIQIGFVVFGFWFTYESIKTASASFALSTSNAQAQLYSQMLAQGRDLQFKFADLFFPGPEGVTQRRDQFIGTLIGYYSSCYELRRVLELPDNAKKLLDADIKESFREELL